MTAAAAGLLLLAVPALAAPPSLTPTITLSLSSSTIVADGVSSVTATATVSNPVMAGGDDVVISAAGGPTVSPTKDNGNGTYTATITSVSVGSAEIIATDRSAPGVADQQPLTQTACAAHIDVTPASKTVVADGTSTISFNAVVTEADHTTPCPNDTVTFGPADHFPVAKGVPDGHGNYSAKYQVTKAVETVPVTVTDGAISGDATVNQTIGRPANISVQPAGVSVHADGTSTIPFTATVTDAVGHPVPNDTVTFGPASYFPTPTGTTDGNGNYTATYHVTTAIGAVAITASDGAATPGRAKVTQTQFGSATFVSAVPSSAVTNQGVTLIATIIPTGGAGAPAPTGSVTFTNNGIPICANRPVVPQPGQALSLSTCQTSFLPSGVPHQITASFTSSSPQIADSGNSTSVAVDRANTTTSLDVSNPTVDVGSIATYKATVTPNTFGPVSPTGSIMFTDGGAPISGCGAQPISGGVATCTVRYNRAGSHNIVARYGGDGNFNASTSQTQQVTVHSLPPRVLGTIKATMQWTFAFTRVFTAIRNFVINGAPIGSTVTVTCRGRGCPFKVSRIPIKRPKPCHSTKRHKCHAPRAGTVDLLSHFKRLRNRHLNVGAQVVITITRKQWIGKYYSFKMRKSRGPAIHIDCLAPGGTKPGVHC